MLSTFLFYPRAGLATMDGCLNYSLIFVHGHKNTQKRIDAFAVFPWNSYAEVQRYEHYSSRLSQSPVPLGG